MARRYSHCTGAPPCRAASHQTLETVASMGFFTEFSQWLDAILASYIARGVARDVARENRIQPLTEFSEEAHRGYGLEGLVGGSSTGGSTSTVRVSSSHVASRAMTRSGVRP